MNILLWFLTSKARKIEFLLFSGSTSLLLFPLPFFCPPFLLQLMPIYRHHRRVLELVTNYTIIIRTRKRLSPMRSYQRVCVLEVNVVALAYEAGDVEFYIKYILMLRIYCTFCPSIVQNTLSKELRTRTKEYLSNGGWSVMLIARFGRTVVLASKNTYGKCLCLIKLTILLIT
ncbi:unnamed protein product [Malus baccata var. baccata]